VALSDREVTHQRLLTGAAVSVAAGPDAAVVYLKGAAVVYAVEVTAMSDSSARKRRGRALLATVVVSAAVTVAAVSAARPPASAAQTPSWTAFVGAPTPGAVYPIAVSSGPPSIGSPGTVGGPITVRDASAIAISPEGETVYITSPTGAQGCGIGTVTSITGGTKHTITFGSNSDYCAISPEAIAVSPSDGTGWVPTRFCEQPYACHSALVELGPTSVIRTIPPRPNLLPFVVNAIAITPDGTTAYIGDTAGSVHSVDLATGMVGKSIRLGTSIAALAVSPDGTQVYVVALDYYAATLTPISIPAETAAPPLVLTSDFPTSIAIDPDGRTAYVADPHETDLMAIDLGNQPLQPPKLIDVGTNPEDVAITPDGGTAYVPTGRCWVQPIRLADGALLKTINVAGGCPRTVAITPDPAPIAELTVGPAVTGDATDFDASASSTPNGDIARYSWDFGDGTTATTTSPTTTHVYRAPGDYTASLTVTNTAGTSTTKVFTGQTMSRNGGPSAHHSRTIRVSSPTVTTIPTPTPPTSATATAPTTPTTPTTTTPTTSATSMSTPPSVPPSPELRLARNVGPPGTVVEVTGTGFAANADVTLVWQPGIGAVTVHTDNTGDLVATILVIPRDTSGVRLLVAKTSPPAAAKFVVVEGTVHPGGSDAVRLIRR
jgi:DNA-binding beta-propeller fold protein YncE